MEKRELIIPLKSKKHSIGQQYFDLDSEKRGTEYLLTFSRRYISSNNKVLISKDDVSVCMTKPEIQQLVSELTKILLFND